MNETEVKRVVEKWNGEANLMGNKTDLVDVLADRKNILQYVKNQLVEELKKAPVGRLRIAKPKTDNSCQYYHRLDEKDTVGKYIKKANRQLAVDLAQKEYNRKAIEEINGELDEITSLLKKYNDYSLENLKEIFHVNRQELITPLIEKDQDFVKKWEEVSYVKKSFDEGDWSEFWTDRGERVRSKSEVLIANALCKKGVPYRYEYPIVLTNGKKIHPDFVCLNIKKRKEIIWEHLGKMDDGTYAELNVKRINWYESAGYFQGDNIIYSMETKQVALSTKKVEEYIDKYLL